jgi:hypothetical protein
VPDAGSATATWRDIDQLAALVGGYCWAEKRIFEVAGEWATGADGAPDGGLQPELRVWCAGVSRRHGQLAACWAERLPVRAGVERAGLVTPPPGPLAEAFDTVAAAPGTRAGVVALVEMLLPRLQAVYDAHRQTPNPVSEGSVVQVLAAAHGALTVEIAGGHALLQGSPTS